MRKQKIGPTRAAGLAVAVIATLLTVLHAQEPAVQFSDVNGRAHTLVAAERKATVLFFLLPDCPISCTTNAATFFGTKSAQMRWISGA